MFSFLVLLLREEFQEAWNWADAWINSRPEGIAVSLRVRFSWCLKSRMWWPARFLAWSLPSIGLFAACYCSDQSTHHVRQDGAWQSCRDLGANSFLFLLWTSFGFHAPRTLSFLRCNAAARFMRQASLQLHVCCFFAKTAKIHQATTSMSLRVRVWASKLVTKYKRDPRLVEEDRFSLFPAVSSWA